MAWFADLSPCLYFGEANASFLRAVGWLERGKPFATGQVDSEVLANLIELVKDPVQPIMLCGTHRCDLCMPKCGVRSHKNVFIPSNGFLFVCPEAIVHYMDAHSYQPPDEFCKAVMACPPTQSQDYLNAALANGLDRWVHHLSR
jgi:hypothetical protein